MLSAPFLPDPDTLIVWRLDRLGRSLRHLIDVIAGLQEREIAFRSLRESIGTTTATGRLQLHLFAALAEFEREAGAHRGREAASSSGVITLGRSPWRPRAAVRRLTAHGSPRAHDGADRPRPEDRTIHLYKHLDLSHEANTEHDLAA